MAIRRTTIIVVIGGVCFGIVALALLSESPLTPQEAESVLRSKPERIDDLFEKLNRQTWRKLRKDSRRVYSTPQELDFARQLYAETGECIVWYRPQFTVDDIAAVYNVPVMTIEEWLDPWTDVGHDSFAIFADADDDVMGWTKLSWRADAILGQ